MHSIRVNAGKTASLCSPSGVCEKSNSLRILMWDNKTLVNLSSQADARCCYQLRQHCKYLGGLSSLAEPRTVREEGDSLLVTAAASTLVIDVTALTSEALGVECRLVFC